ncbi:MAG: hypothetical protein KC621_08570 [Myxococcales bacterium]|nr:hypothetical protein [Myxococcales bacterium]
MSSTARGGKRSEADHYPTPAWCVDRLLEACALPGGRWLEPCAGEGAIAEAVLASRDDVMFDLHELRPDCLPALQRIVPDGRIALGDVLLRSPPRTRYDVVITNPPFSSAQPVLEWSLRAGTTVVLLLRLNFLGTRGRAAFMRRHPPDVYVLPDRPSFTGKGTDSIEYAWFVWPRERREAGTIRVLATTDKDQRQQRKPVRGPDQPAPKDALRR